MRAKGGNGHKKRLALPEPVSTLDAEAITILRGEATMEDVLAMISSEATYMDVIGGFREPVPVARSR